jgi:hypothetical protein
MATQEGSKNTEEQNSETDTNESGENQSFDIDGTEFDPERAMRTIKTQREAEKELKAELAKYREAEEAELEKQKSLETKLTEREQRISELEGTLTELAIRGDFERKGLEMGFDQEDLVLAYMAAKEEDLLGAYDPKTGEIEAHDFDTLQERYPKLSPSGEQDGGQNRQRFGDAGVRSNQGSARTPADQFNDSVRKAIFRR